MIIKLKMRTFGSISWRNVILANILLICLLVSTARGLSSVDERAPRKLFGGYRITPKFCRASKTLPQSDPRANGPTICMFNHECAQRQGEVVGACMDGFLFGACCQVQEDIDSSILQQNSHTSPKPSNLAAALSYETYGQQQSSNEVSYQKVPMQQHNTYGSEPVNVEYDGQENNYYDNGANEVDNDIQPDNIYITNSHNTIDNHKPDKFIIGDQNVVISSPSESYNDKIPSYYPVTTVSSITTYTNGQMYLPSLINYSPELPMLITGGPFSSTYIDEPAIIQSTPAASIITANGIHNIADNLVNNPPILEDEGEFTHSDITHPSADSVLIEDDLQFSTGYGPSTVYVPAPVKQESTTAAPVIISSTTRKPTPKKPIFKPKPTTATIKESTTMTTAATIAQSTDDKYVLVQTITNEKPMKKPSTGISADDLESIESILLQLNDTKHSPAYDTEKVTTETNKYTYNPSQGTQKPSLSSDIYAHNGFYITTVKPQTTGISTRRPIPSRIPIIVSSPSNSYDNTLVSTYPVPSSTILPPKFSLSSTFAPEKDTGILDVSTHRPTTIHISSTTAPSTTIKMQSTTISTSIPTTTTTTVSTTTSRPTTTEQRRPKPPQPILHDNEIIISPTRRPPTWVPPIKNTDAPSTSYVTGPTQPRPSVATGYVGTSPSTASEKLDNQVQSTTPTIYFSSYGQPLDYSSTTQRIGDVNNEIHNSVSENPGYIKIPGTVRPRPSPTVIITPKPTVNMVTSSSWTQQPNIVTQFTTPTSGKLPSNSYIYNPVVTKRPNFMSSTEEYINLPQVISNDFDDPGYYGSSVTDRPSFGQFNTESVFTPAPGDDRPSYPGYYGPTPTYPAFMPTASVFSDNAEEEIYTSPNDFVNFPPVRNPNLNLSATQSSVTSDVDISTPAFVEDDVLKDKMNTLVSKIVESLQGNFDALADIIEERNVSTTVLQSDITTRKPSTIITTKRVTGRPSSTTSRIPQRTTSRRPVSGSADTAAPAKPTTNKKPTTKTTKRPSVTRRPTSTTAQTQTPPTKRSTSKPSTSRRTTIKPTKKVTTTTVEHDGLAPEEIDENVGEEVEEIAGNSSEAEESFRCGVRPHVKSGRIVGGKGATFGEWPWQVLVRESTWLGLFTKNKCGGVLITNRYVVTAAHCQPGFLASLVAVFGEFDISGDLETKRSVTKNVKRVIVHRQYDQATFENDLALLELDTPIHYDTHIIPICMPPDEFDFTGRKATVTGWGRLKYGGGVPSVLQEVQVPIIENSVCQEMFHTAGHNKKILPSFLCAGYANGQKDSCEGDSGGPLVLQRDDGRWELAGTVSHGIKCAAPYLPGVYMRTTYYKPWLKSITGVK